MACSETRAQVAKIEVLPGTPVEADTVLLRLSSPQAENDLRNAEAQVAVAEARFAAKHVELQSQLMSERSSQAQAQADYALAKVKSDAEAKAMAKDLIPRVQYEQEPIALKQLQYRTEVEQQRVQTFGAGIAAQMAAVRAELQLQRSNLTLRQRQSEHWTCAPARRHVATGRRAGRSAGRRRRRPGAGGARRRADRAVARAGSAGQGRGAGHAGAGETYNGMIAGSVTRIDPAVVDGSVQVEVTPTGALPAGARPDLSVDGRIRIAKLDQVLSLGRPAQAEANSEVGLFRLDASGNTATRIKVRVGATSVDRVQLLQGLAAGRSGGPFRHQPMG